MSATDETAEEATAARGDAPEGERGHVLLVTGRSGAGRTTAIAALEDLGFERIDTPPLALVPAIVRELVGQGRRRIAIGVDARTAGFSIDGFTALVEALRSVEKARATVVFLDGQDEALRRRYTETRRRHPLAPNGALEDGLRLDRLRMRPLRDHANIVIDTSDLRAGDLKALLRDRIAIAEAPGMTISVVSFAYRRGLPPAADMVFDCRFLANPHYAPALKELDGRDADVRAFVERDPLYRPFFDSVCAQLDLLGPAFAKEGKSYLTLAFGCTGGQHRSVTLAEATARHLATRGWAVRVRHRERDHARILEPTPRRAGGAARGAREHSAA